VLCVQATATAAASVVSSSLKKKPDPSYRARVPIHNESPVSIAIAAIYPNEQQPEEDKDKNDDDGDEDDRWHVLTPREGIPPGGTFHLETYVEAKFEIYELMVVDVDTTEEEEEEEGEQRLAFCAQYGNTADDCWETSFTIPEGYEIDITLTGDFQVEIVDDITRAAQYAAQILDDETCNEGTTNFTECLEHKLTASLNEWNIEWHFQFDALKRMGNLLQEYLVDKNTNFDGVMNGYTPKGAPPLYEYIWKSSTSSSNQVHVQQQHKVHVLHKRPSSRIYLIENFVTEQECRTLQNTGEPHWKQNTSDGKWHAEIHVPTEQGNPVTLIQQRIYNYTRDVVPERELLQGPMILTKYKDPQLCTEDQDKQMENSDNERTLHLSPTSPIATMILHCQINDDDDGDDDKNANNKNANNKNANDKNANDKGTNNVHIYFPTAGIYLQPTLHAAVFIVSNNNKAINNTIQAAVRGLTDYKIYGNYDRKMMVTQQLQLLAGEEHTLE